MELGTLPGRAHDLTATRMWEILRKLNKAGIIIGVLMTDSLKLYGQAVI